MFEVPVQPLSFLRPNLPVADLAVVAAVGSVVVPALAGVAAARYGRFSPTRAALVSVGVSLVGAAVLSGVGVALLANNVP